MIRKLVKFVLVLLDSFLSGEQSRGLRGSSVPSAVGEWRISGLLHQKLCYPETPKSGSTPCQSSVAIRFLAPKCAGFRSEADCRS